MKRCLTLTVLFVLMTAADAWAFGTSVLWSRIDGDAAYQSVSAAAVDQNDNLILVGDLVGELDFGAGPMVCQGSQDAYLAKFDPNGEVLWSQRFGMTGTTRILDVAVHEDIGIVVTGEFSGTVDFGSGVMTCSVASYRDAFLVAFNTYGGCLWQEKFGQSGRQTGKAVAISNFHRVFVIGDYTDDLEIHGTPLEGDPDGEIFLTSFLTTGSHSRSMRFGYGGEQHAKAIACDPDGDLMMAVEGINGMRFDESLAFIPVAGVDICVIRADRNFHPLGGRLYGSSEDEFIYDIISDSGGNIVISGYYLSPLDFGGGALPGYGSSFVTMLGANFDHMWTTEFAAWNEMALSLDINDDNQIAVAGGFTGELEIGSRTLVSAGGLDAVAGRLEFDGSLDFVDWFGDVEGQAFTAVGITDAGDVYAAGDADGTFSFGPEVLSSQGDDVMAGKIIPILPGSIDVTDFETIAFTASMFTVPWPGLGSRFDNCYGPGGTHVDATITLRIAINGEPIVGYPAEDIWLMHPTGDFIACNGASIADQATDETGTTYWREDMPGGGWADHSGPGLQLMIAGVMMDHDPLPIAVNSSDINGDLSVNLLDLQEFTQDFYGPYVYRSDFFWDGTLNLIDLSLLAQSYGAACWTAKTTDPSTAVGTVKVVFADGFSSTSAKNGEHLQARIVARGVAADAIAGWECDLAIDGLAVEGIEFGGDALNVRDDLRFAVGVKTGTLVESQDGVVLATLDLCKIGFNRASLSLVDRRTGEIVDGAICVLAGDDEVYELDLEVAGPLGEAALVEPPCTATEHSVLAVTLASNPNPFNPMTTVSYHVPRDEAVRLDVYALDGSLVETLVDRILPAGQHESRWQGRDRSGREMPSGTYILRLNVGGEVATMSVALVR